MRMVVDLPEPFGPRKPYTLARGTLRSTWSTATSAPKRLVSPRARIASSASGALCGRCRRHRVQNSTRTGTPAGRSAIGAGGVAGIQLDLGQPAQP
jgi:hypothetical protein